MKIIDLNKIKENFYKKMNNKVFSNLTFPSILSFSYTLPNSFKLPDILYSLNNYQYSPFYFSNGNLSKLGFINEISFDCSKDNKFSKIGSKIIDIFNSSIILGENHLTAFGGFSFDMQEQSCPIWANIPKGRLMIPRYYFSKKVLSINMLMKKHEDMYSIKNKFISYIDGLEKILVRSISSKAESTYSIENLLQKEKYFNRINSVIKTLNDRNNTIKKIVVSRKKKISSKLKMNICRIIKKLELNCQDSMTFLYTFDEDNFIIGSSPELLLSINDDTVITEALAGSNIESKNKSFLINQKERSEQSIVLEYIIDILKDYVNEISYDKTPKLKNAYNIQHLRSKIEGRANRNINILDLMNRLHPTPAVAGYPTESAKEIISSFKESRGWYSGAIGWLDSNLNGSFYVNLRSGFNSKNDMYLFAGSGIMQDSDPESEWKETERKFSTMLEAIQ